MDFRFIEGLNNMIKDKGLKKDCDVVSVAGAAGAVLDKESQAYLLKQITLSYNLHKIEKVILVNHLDCGAYGGSKAFASNEAEYQRHEDDLAKAKALIENTVPDLTVETMLASIDGRTVAFDTVDDE